VACTFCLFNVALAPIVAFRVTFFPEVVCRSFVLCFCLVFLFFFFSLSFFQKMVLTIFSIDCRQGRTTLVHYKKNGIFNVAVERTFWLHIANDEKEVLWEVRPKPSHKNYYLDGAIGESVGSCACVIVRKGYDVPLPRAVLTQDLLDLWKHHQDKTNHPMRFVVKEVVAAFLAGKEKMVLVKWQGWKRPSAVPLRTLREDGIEVDPNTKLIVKPDGPAMRFKENGKIQDKRWALVRSLCTKRGREVREKVDNNLLKFAGLVK
jgi:hypothetical protein